MIRNYFKIALRHLAKHRLYSFVNIAGLTIALTACMLIGLYVWNETHYDRFHENSDRIVRVTMEYGDAGTVNKTAMTGTKVGPEFKRQFPEIEAFARTMIGSRVIKTTGQVFTENKILFADSAFLSIFSFPLLEGDSRTCLNSPEKLILSKATAVKYFGNESAVGKFLDMSDGSKMIVSGVVGDVPGNSQIQFDIVMPFMNLSAAKQEEQWFTANYVTYLLLTDKKSITTVQEKITRFMKEVSGKELFPGSQEYLTHKLERLKDVHLFSEVEGGLEAPGNITYIYILSVIAFLILLIACVNYSNLAIAQSAGRMVEVGMRKVLGANRKQLVFQFLGESIVLAGISLLISIALCFLLLPYMNEVSGSSLEFSFIGQPAVLAILLAIVFLISVVTGLYPALAVSGRKPGVELKSGSRVASSGGYVRKMMIVFQFVVSVFLISSTIIVTQQLKYIREKDLGYKKDHLLILPIDSQTREHIDELKVAIAGQSGVLGVTGGYESPSYIQWSDGISYNRGFGEQQLSVSALPVSLDFIATMGMKLEQGRDFLRSDLVQKDSSGNNDKAMYSFILNEQAVAAIGWTPMEAIGKTIDKGMKGVIRGVVKDFNFSSLHEPIGPLVIFLEPELCRQMFVRIKGQNVNTTLAELEKTWKSRVGHRPFEYNFLDEEYNRLYKAEQSTAQVFALFSGLAVFLACLGLFALAAFTTVQRTKEIGIRKVLGASVTGIIMMLSKEFLVLVGISILITIPLAWYAGTKWLQDFAYRVELSWWMFLMAGCTGVIVALLAVSMQAIKAALVKPVKSLRSE